MKKQLKKLALTKKVVANFQTIFGGIDPPSRRRSCKETCEGQNDDPLPDRTYDFTCRDN